VLHLRVECTSEALDSTGIDILTLGVPGLLLLPEEQFGVQVTTSMSEENLRRKKADFFARAAKWVNVHRGLFLEIDPSITMFEAREILRSIGMSFAREKGLKNQKFGWAKIYRDSWSRPVYESSTFSTTETRKEDVFDVAPATIDTVAKQTKIDAQTQTPAISPTAVVLQKTAPPTTSTQSTKEAPLREGVILAWCSHPGHGPIRATDGTIFHLIRADITDEQLKARLDKIGPKMKALNDPSDRILIRFRDGGPPPIPDDQAEQKKRQKWRKDNAAIDAQRLIA
jgi:hypothetical protein